MYYYEDAQVWLQLGSKDENVRPRAEPNVAGSYVRDLQNDLNALGFAAGSADGWFGPATQTAVRALQSDARAAARQEQGSALQPGRRFEETPSPFTGDATGIVEAATASEIQRWKAKRWQQPAALGSLAIEDVRAQLPINTKMSASIRRPGDIQRVVLHCTDAAPSWDVFQCARYDVGPNHISARGCPTITYAYFVNADGSVQKCLSHDTVSWHVGDWNRSSLGVVLAYRASGNTAPPPAIQVATASELFARLCATLSLSPATGVVGHRELLGTGYTIQNGMKQLRKECPGLKIDLDEFRQDVARRLALQPQS